jgi:tripartite-type tricarboxylate transporter receptor subunit TctC
VEGVRAVRARDLALDQVGDLDQRLRHVLARERADRHAEAAKKALRTSDVKRARQEARLALRYWGDDPLTGKDVPEALVEVADLVER